MKKNLLIIPIGILAISCATKKNQTQPYVQMDEIELPRPIGVGNAEIQLEIIEYDNVQLLIKVKKIYGYGMSADRLEPEQQLNIYVHESLKEEIVLMEKNSVLDALITSQPAGINIPKSWELIEILNLK